MRDRTMKLLYFPERATKTCYVYRHGGETDHQTLYLKKDSMTEHGIPEGKTLLVTVEVAP